MEGFGGWVVVTFCPGMICGGVLRSMGGSSRQGGSRAGSTRGQHEGSRAGPTRGQGEGIRRAAEQERVHQGSRVQQEGRRHAPMGCRTSGG